MKQLKKKANLFLMAMAMALAVSMVVTMTSWAAAPADQREDQGASKLQMAENNMPALAISGHDETLTPTANLGELGGASDLLWKTSSATIEEVNLAANQIESAVHTNFFNRADERIPKTFREGCGNSPASILYGRTAYAYSAYESGADSGNPIIDWPG